MPLPIRRRAWSAGVVLVLAALAACSSSSADSKDSTTTKGTEKTTTTIVQPKGPPIERYADYQSANYDDPSHWVCRPDQVDICDRGLDATVVQADGTLEVEPFHAAPDAPIDCFYVYPTISRDKGAYSDWEASDEEEGYVTLNQAARLQSECRLFAPVYRQGTLGGLAARINGDTPTEQGDPYADVLDAFRTYMAEDNHGRGVVLIGHSQGTGMLHQLITEEIDPNPDVRKQLVGAYLAGGTVGVPEGKAVGGDFDEIPLCTEEGETGCIVNWVTYRSTSPPPSDAFFGRPGRDGMVAACVNPAAIGGGPGELDAYLPANSQASILSSLGTTSSGAGWLDEAAGTVTTPFVRLPGLATGQCTSTDGFNYLAAEVHPDPGPRADDIVGDLTPQWGLHLVDVNLVMGNLVEDVKAQAETYTGG
ncbi:MAG TPA: DUF3089 domain-containing protein [Acidimicrobiales bacterium]|jgi:hypothetical protein|nr:DUF3089 domain-containing protein [Acidimicrobiales bacterium]